MTSPTKAQLQERLDAAKKEIGRLEDEIETLEGEVRGLEGELEMSREYGAEDVARRFVALVDALDDHVPLRTLPISLRLDLETLAEHLAVPLPIRRSA